VSSGGANATLQVLSEVTGVPAASIGVSYAPAAAGQSRQGASSARKLLQDQVRGSRLGLATVEDGLHTLQRERERDDAGHKGAPFSPRWFRRGPCTLQCIACLNRHV